MTITNIDDAIAGAQPPIEWQKAGATMAAIGRWHSLLYTAGNPGASIAPTPGISGAALTAYDGQIPFSNPVSGETRLLRASCLASQQGTLLICDRLWHNSSISVTTTTGQSINSVAWPARDRNGSTDGDGVLIGLEVSSALGAAANTTATLTYTNSAGTGSRTATFGAAAPYNLQASSQAGTFAPFLLAAGDQGVRSIQTLTLGTSLVSGVAHLVAYRVLARIPTGIANVDAAVDIITGGAVKLYDNTVPFLIWIPTSTTGVQASGQIIYTQG